MVHAWRFVFKVKCLVIIMVKSQQTTGCPFRKTMVFRKEYNNFIISAFISVFSYCFAKSIIINRDGFSFFTDTLYLRVVLIFRIGDINGDGRDDLICKDNSAKGNIWYSKNIGKPNFKSTTFYSTFCRSSNPLNFHLADVTGDKKKDLLCINKIGHAQIGVSTCR